jgi:hypothetical protein
VKPFLSILVLGTFLAMLPIAAMADSVPVGDLEFNSLSAGVNDFTVNNFTGSNNLGFFPVADNIIFDNAVVMATESNGTILTFDLGNLAPGTDTSAQVSDSLLFTQVVFSATLDPSTFTLTNGFSGTFAADPTLSFTLYPSSGADLVAGVDLGAIDASSVVTPEPSTISLFALGLLGVAGFRARKHRTNHRV